MTTDLDKLEQVARAATPGPWEVSLCSPTVINKNKNRVKEVVRGRDPMDQKDRDFIAQANPSTVLELIERVRVTEQQLRSEREAHFGELANAQERAKDFEGVVREFAMNGMDVETLEHVAQVMEKWHDS